MIHFDFKDTYRLENDRVLLRPLEKDDFLHLLPFSEKEPELWKFSFFPAAGKVNLGNYIEIALAARKAQKEYPFVVFDKLKNSYAGSTRFYDIQRENESLQLGYTWYGSAFQGTGLNKHCKFLLLQFAFDILGAQRVEFRADYRNERSIAAMKSIGCTVEGILRKNGITSSGIRRDSIVLSILREEWDAKLKEKLKSKLF